MGKIILAVYYLLFFAAGVMATILYLNYSNVGITGNVVSMPSDYVSDRQIYVYPDEVVIKINDSQVSNYEATGSMIPILGQGANGITIVPSSEEEIRVGDIVTYNRDGELIVHRVIEKGLDSEGIYFITKGDSNSFSDGKVRFSEIEHKLIGLIY